MDEHSLHSPFFYDFYTKVVKQESQSFETIEKLRRELLSSKLEVSVNDLGAGSVLNSDTRKVSDIAGISLSPERYSQLYARTIEYFKCKHVLELGTSLGINTLYLGMTKNTRVFTFEGSPAITEIARDTFTFANAKNITLIEGNIDTTLPSYLANHGKIDFAFVDANHRYSAVMDYFNWLVDASHEKTVLVFDDIHLNSYMQKAWTAICKHELVYATADLYRCGFVFFEPSLNRQNWILRF